jgi:hypothetical protein
MFYTKQLFSKKALVCIVGLFTCLYFLFYIKYSVNNLLYQKSDLQKIINKEKKNIGALSAELSLLQNPVRIKKIIIKNTPLMESRLEQIILNENENLIPIIKNSSNLIDKWRYKRANKDV